MRINSGRRVSGLTVISKSMTCSAPEQRMMNKKPVAIELELSLGHRFFYLLFSLQTIRFHHQPYPDFHPLLKCAFLPGTAHASLPDHNLLPERDLTSNKVLYQSIHTRYLAQPRFKLFFFRLRWIESISKSFPSYVYAIMRIILGPLHFTVVLLYNS